MALVAAVSVVALMAGCHRGASDKSEPANIVVAIVDGQEIHGDIFLKEYKAFKKRIKISDANDEELEKQMRDGVMDNILKNVIVAKEAEKAGVRITRQMEDEAIQSMLKGFSQARLQEILEKQNQSYDDWKESVRRNLLMEKFIATVIAPSVDIPEADIEAYYDGHQEEFRRPAQAHVLHILCINKDAAEKVRVSLVAGADFADTARKYSKSPEAAQGGDLGMVSQEQMPKELNDEIFKLKVNETSRVVESPYGYHIMKVVSFSKPRLMSFAEGKDAIYKELFQDRLERKFEEWMRETKEKAQIQVFTDRLYRL